MIAPVAHSPLPAPAILAGNLTLRLPAFGHISWVDDTGSTNADLLTRARSGDATRLPWLRGAHLQTGGRGRAGRTWQNAPGTCLMMSCAFPVSVPGHRLPELSPLAGLAAGEALRALAGAAAPDIKVKWPNDVQFQGKKLGGILVETTRQSGTSQHVVVIGMGMNLTRADALSAELARGIADWSEITATAATTRPEDTGADIATALAHAWQGIIVDLQSIGFAGLRDRYCALDALAGETVNVLDQGTILFSGTAHGYDDNGRLLVDTGHEILPVSVGDVSVRIRA